MAPEFEIVVDTPALLGEGPCWDQERQQLYWVDIYQKRLHIFQPSSATNRTIQLPDLIGCAVPRAAGGMLLALQNGFATLDLESEALTYVTDPEADLPDNRFNDGKCDPAGRFLAGTMDNKEEGAVTGSLYSVAANFEVRRLFEGVAISNGIAWSPDYGTMYYIDSPTQRVVAFDYDLDKGTVSNRRVIITLTEPNVFPDGMTSDLDGMLWIALWGGESVTRWNPATGELLERIYLPALNVSSCTFGGPQLNELYVTTARKGTDEATLAKYPKTGSLFRIQTDVTGMPSFAFAG